MTFKIIETFSGIGSQAKAFSKIKNRFPKLDYEVVATVEWEIGAIYSYDIIHNGVQNLTKYSNWSKDKLVENLTQLNLSSDGKNSMSEKSIRRLPLDVLKALKHSIDNNNNLIDISTVHAKDLPDADLLTYSFPCQDLSVSSYWHRNFSGIDKDAQNRSGLLWEIERILREYHTSGKQKPRFLLMENVSAIHSAMHVQNFNLWINELKEFGYTSFYFDLDSSNFGIPQTRVRTFMISVLVDDLTPHQVNNINLYFSNTELFRVDSKPQLAPFLRLDYTNLIYREEAVQSTPNKTVSRDKILAESLILAQGGQTNKVIAKTITTKQDRNPNAGIVIHDLNLGSEKSKYRNLTSREAFLLMGFDETDYQILVDNNLQITRSSMLLSNSKLLRLAGNSIVVNILEEIFREIIQVNETIINPPHNIFPLKKDVI
ncbi:DNA (cytosine-5-)-methyltransferase [Listeria monocytogenes]|nr:DNA (cytosine-5-)-methyltransferase [Listeria monocytogenes]EKZ1641209.1 DNA (cytosine-5-)-methyltransferase [Listeria monocytogenes]